MKQLEHDFAIDLKAERYEQRTGWGMFASGGSQLQPLYAYFVSVGLSKRF